MPTDQPAARTIGTSQFATALSSLAGVVIGALTIAYFQGSIEVTNRVVFPSTGSGVVFESGKVDYRLEAVQHTNTGGLSKYDTFIQCNPFNGTGFLLTAALAIDNNPANSSFDCSFTKAVATATGGFLLMNNVSGTGGWAVFTSGSGGTAIKPALSAGRGQIWTANQCLKCGTITAPTSSFSGALIYEAIDYPGR